MGPGGTVREEPVFGVNPFTGGPPALVSPGTTDAIHKRHIVQFINRENADPRTMATWTNAVQQVAEARRLGTPSSSSPIPATTTGPSTFGSPRPRPPSRSGRDAGPRRDPRRRARGGVRPHRAQEYVSVGIRGLPPTADVATEPRWGRFRETFGEDADLTTELVTAVVRGFQGRSSGRGASPSPQALPRGRPRDRRAGRPLPLGQGPRLPGRNLEYHLRPWKAAIAAGTAMIMPYYAVPKGIASEEVGMAYNKEIVADLLRASSATRAS